MSTVQPTPPLLDQLPPLTELRKRRRFLFFLRRRQVSRYHVEDRLVAEGAHGKVKLATVEGFPSSTKVVVKSIKGDHARTLARREAEVHIACHHHPHVVKCLDLVQTKPKTYLVLQHAPGGDLFDYVCRNNPLSLTATATVMRQMCSAVAHVHAHGYVHRDIKPENVLLLDGTRHTLLCDFGHAAAWNESRPPMTGRCGTPRCMPPEMFVRGKSGRREYNPRAVDAFSLGNLMFFMLTGKFPFEGATPSDTVRNIVSGQATVPFPRGVSDSCRHLLQGLLDPDPEARITPTDALRHPFFARRKGSG